MFFISGVYFLDFCDNFFKLTSPLNSLGSKTSTFDPKPRTHILISLKPSISNSAVRLPSLFLDSFCEGCHMHSETNLAIYFALIFKGLREKIRSIRKSWQIFDIFTTLSVS